jgi:hypothetical protein
MSENFALPPLKRPPTYGIYRWWPEDGENWIHPEDVGVVRQMVPGLRVFRREDLDDVWLMVTYGEIQFRVKSTIWFEVPFEGFNVGDHVEVKSRMGQAEPGMGRIKEMVWNQRYARIEYYLFRSDKTQVRAYHADDLSPIESISATPLDGTRPSSWIRPTSDE